MNIVAVFWRNGITVRAADFEVEELFSALRGMMRPLLPQNSAVALIVEEPIVLPTITTDEGKVSQILRNFISNALKFTERGEVRVAAQMRDSNTITFSVADTGIGIATADQTRIFEEFIQIENPLQKRVQGTGSGLPLQVAVASRLYQNLSYFKSTVFDRADCNTSGDA
jgi:signal transduction histidine kinase